MYCFVKEYIGKIRWKENHISDIVSTMAYYYKTGNLVNCGAFIAKHWDAIYQWVKQQEDDGIIVGELKKAFNS